MPWQMCDDPLSEIILTFLRLSDSFDSWLTLCLCSSATNTSSLCAAPTGTPTRTSATGARRPANSSGSFPESRTAPAPQVSHVTS